MHRGIAAYFIVLVILVLIALYLSGVFTGGNRATTTVPGGGKHIGNTTATTSLTTTVPGGVTSASTTTQTTTSIAFSSCLAKSATQSIPNGNFSTGTYASWNVTGPGFGSAPFNIINANQKGAYYAAPWSGYNGTYMATSFQTGVALQAGNLTSLPFTVTEPYLNFRIISQQNSLLYVEVLRAGIPVIVAHYNTYVSPPGVKNPQSTFVNASIPVSTLLCQNVTIGLVAGIVGKSSQGTNYIAAGGFVLSRSPAVNPTQPVNQTIST